jgi:hypothetical protein
MITFDALLFRLLLLPFPSAGAGGLAGVENVVLFIVEYLAAVLHVTSRILHDPAVSTFPLHLQITEYNRGIISILKIVPNVEKA